MRIRDLYPTAVIVYRIVYLLNAVISFLGTILVIREFTRKHDMLTATRRGPL